MKYFRVQTVVRLIFSAALIAGVWHEAGQFTALAIALLAISVEAISYSVGILVLDRLHAINAFTESLLKRETSDKIDA